MLPKIQRFDRANGDESTTDFFPAVAKIAGLLDMNRKEVLTAYENPTKSKEIG